MVSGFGRTACTIAAMLLFAVAKVPAAPTKVPVARGKAPAAPKKVLSDSDCLSCHNQHVSARLQARPVSLYINAETYQPSVHSKLGCVSCHSDIHAFPHPDKVRPVTCVGCHEKETSAYADSIHAVAEREKKKPRYPACLDCHGNPHGIRADTDPKSRVYPLNLPRTCGNCHGNPEIAKKYGFPDVYALYMDSIHGFALTTDGLLVAATCGSCHGAHDILSRKNPKSRTFWKNVPATCGGCHAGIHADYLAGAHGAAMIAGRAKAPVCTNCHTAHQIAHVDANWQVKTVATCGNCHKDRLHSYRDTFHGQVTQLGFVATARCWSCHGAHVILPAANPKSKVAAANLPATCGKCHAGATASFVSYEPHPNAHDRRRNPGLYYSRIFMNLLLLGVFVFFGLHTALWLVRSLVGARRVRITSADKDDGISR